MISFSITVGFLLNASSSQEIGGERPVNGPAIQSDGVSRRSTGAVRCPGSEGVPLVEMVVRIAGAQP
jgi:hypothetical protein